MTRYRLLKLTPLLLAACISSNSPLPQVRWFDPAPLSWPQPERVGVLLPVPQVTASPIVRQEFVVRIAAREIAIDDGNRWMTLPERIVAAALERAMFGPGSGVPGKGTVSVKVERFEIDLTSSVRAYVELQVALPLGIVVCTGNAEANGREPSMLAAAMAEALAMAVVKVRSALLAN